MKLLSIITLLFISTITIAQTASTGTGTNYSNEELKLFIKTNQEVSKIQQKGEQQMITEVQNQDMTVERYNELVKAQQNPESMGIVTPEELKRFQSITEKIEKIQVQVQQDVNNKIQEMGLTMDKYQKLMSDYQQNPAMQKRINELIGS